MRIETLLFLLALPFFAAAQTPVEERLYDKLTLREGEKPPLPPAQTAGVEQFQRGVLWGWRKPYLETHFDSLSELALPIRNFFAPVLADRKMALASLKTGKVEFENAEYLQPPALAELLKMRPDLPKNIKWAFRAQHLDGRAVLIETSGKIFELNN